MIKSFPEFNPDCLNTYSARDRQSKVHANLEARPVVAGASFAAFLDSLPRVLKAAELTALAKAVVRARQRRKPVIAMLGGHVIKTGCAPILIHLVQSGFVTHVAANGSAAIHDTELALFGHTSEAVADRLEDGSFGMARDTARFVNQAARKAAELRRGFGQTLGWMLDEADAPHAERALLVACVRNGVAFTLHIALGTDIVHQHASADGAAIGEASMRDFRILAQTVSHLGDGGVVLNLGSAVIMPEVFLKCLSMARNVRKDVRDFITADFDMLRHYRPTVNVLVRPVSLGGRSFAITGHHEIMIPLFAAAVMEYAEHPRTASSESVDRETTGD